MSGCRVADISVAKDWTQIDEEREDGDDAELMVDDSADCDTDGAYVESIELLAHLGRSLMMAGGRVIDEKSLTDQSLREMYELKVTNRCCWPGGQHRRARGADNDIVPMVQVRLCSSNEIRVIPVSVYMFHVYVRPWRVGELDNVYPRQQCKRYACASPHCLVTIGKTTLPIRSRHMRAACKLASAMLARGWRKGTVSRRMYTEYGTRMSGTTITRLAREQCSPLLPMSLLSPPPPGSLVDDEFVAVADAVPPTAGHPPKCILPTPCSGRAEHHSCSLLKCKSAQAKLYEHR